MHVENRKKDILVLAKGSRQGLDDTIITAEARYPINFTRPRRRSVLSLDYNGSDCFLFANAVKVRQCKAKDLEIKPYPLCLGNISNNFTIDNLKKTELNRYVHVICVGYNIIDTEKLWHS